MICDDCSKDSTWSILEEYAQRDSRIRIYENEKNLGVKHNFEKAISLTEGEFIAFSDQDDNWMPNHLELLLKAIENKSMACGNAEMMYEDGTSMNMTLQYQDAFDYIPEDDLKKALTVILFRNPFQGASMLIRRELAEKHLEGVLILRELRQVLFCNRFFYALLLGGIYQGDAGSLEAGS